MAKKYPTSALIAASSTADSGNRRPAMGKGRMTTSVNDDRGPKKAILINKTRGQ